MAKDNTKGIENINQHSNTAIVGLDMDSSINQITPGRLSYALNAAVENFDANSVNYQNEPGNELCVQFPEGFVLIGNHHIAEQDKHIFFITDPSTGDSQIGYMENNDCIYHTLVSSSCLNFSIHHPIHDNNVKHRITNCSTEIYWTDGYNPRRYLDLDNIPRVLISGTPLCNPQYTDELDCNQLKVQSNFSIPFIEVVDVVSGGNNTAGVYQFAAQYADASSNPYTSYYSVTNPVPLADTQVTSMNFNYPVGKSIVLNVTNLDITGQFKYFNIAVIKTINGISSAELVGTYSIEDDSRKVTYSGGETNIKLSIQDVFERFPYYDIAQNLTTAQDVLIWDQLSSVDRVNYQQIANGIHLLWETWRIPATESYADEVNAGTLRSFLRDESYALEIAFLLDNGGETDGFHIPGRTKNSFETSLADIAESDEDFVGTPTYYSGGVGYSPYWKIYNTASVIGYSNGYSTDPTYKGPWQYGEFAYTESTDTYPCNTEVWGDLAGKPIRHHKFPDVAVSPIFETKLFTNQYSMVMGNDAIFPIGIKVNPVEIAMLINSSNLTAEQKSSIVGFKILRGDRSTNKSIVAKGILRNVGTYTKDDKDYYYPNYPYNDLREDPFINSVNNAYTSLCQPFAVEVTALVADPLGGPPYMEVEYIDCNTNKATKAVFYSLGYQDAICSTEKPTAISGTANISYINYDTYKFSVGENFYGGYCAGWRVEYNDVTRGITREWVNGSDEIVVRVVVGSIPQCVEGCDGTALTGCTDKVKIEKIGDSYILGTCHDEVALPPITDQYRLIFNSPETSFGQPFLGNILKLESVIFGKGKAHFTEVQKNAKYKLISKEAIIDALDSSAALGGMTSDFNTAAMFAAYQAYLTTYINGITRKNYAYSFNSIADYNYTNSVPNGLGIKQRNLSIAKYLIPSVIAVEGETTSVNNWNRETSVFLKTDEDKSALPFPDSSPNMLSGANPLVTEYSRFTISEAGNCGTPGREEDIRVVSYYASLKNNIDNQWGQIYSYETIDTGYRQLLNDAPTTIFGGDTFIGRFNFKTKVPFFIDNRVGAPDDSDIFYDEIGNIGYPKYWHSSRSILESYTVPPGSSDDSPGTLTNIISYKAHNFDCPNATATTTLYGTTTTTTTILSGGLITVDGINTSTRTFYDGYFYLFAYGVPSFYCESSYNLDLRQAFNNREGDFWPHVTSDIPDDWVQESFVSIANDNTYYYNTSFSKQNKETAITHLPPDWTDDSCMTNYPFRAIYSDVQSVDSDNRVNAWRIYRSTSYYDFPQNHGKLISLDGIQNRAILARFENKTLLYDNLLTIDTSNPQAAYVGNPKLFANPPIDFADTDLGYVGSQHQMMLKIPQGQIIADAKRGQVFLISGREAIDLSGFGSGLNRFFTDHLAFEILRYFPTVDVDNHFNGLGLHGVYDSKYDRVILTKLDYVPTSPDVKYDNVTNEFYVEEVIPVVITLATTTTSTTTSYCGCCEYGLLYNWYACAGTGSNSLSSSDDWTLLSLGGIGVTGADKEIGTTYWNSPNTGATNIRGLSFKGCGYRSGTSGSFASLKTHYMGRTSPTLDYEFLSSSSAVLTSANGDNRYRLGFPQRFINYNTTLSVGDYGIYTGNDGKTYATKCISVGLPHTKGEVMLCDLIETQYRDHTSIPEVTSDAAWKALNTGALCAYNNDWANVGCIQPTTTTTTTVGA